MAAVFTTSGTFFLTDLLIAGTTATVWAIGFGSGTTTEAAGDDDLENRATEGTVIATATQEQSGASDTAEWIGTVTINRGSGFSVEEAALFWDSTGTTSKMLIHGTHTTVAAATDDQIRYTFRLQQT
jgi:hypothetical protein